MLSSLLEGLTAGLQQSSGLAFLLVFAAGLLFTLSPCTLSMVPVVIGYVGGYSQGAKRSKLKGFTYALFFVLGNATVLAVLGGTISYVGEILRQKGPFWYIFLAVVLLTMGIHLLGIYRFKFSGGVKIRPRARGILGAYLLGALLGFATTPCQTPILTAILAYVAMGGGTLFGAGLLFLYALGKGIILIAVGTFAGLIKNSEKVARWSLAIEKVSGVVLIGASLSILWKI